MFYHGDHHEHSRAVNTAGKGGYTSVVLIIYGVPTPLTENYHDVIDNINTIDQGMKTQSYKLEGL